MSLSLAPFGSSADGEELPGSRHTLEVVFATIVELDARANDEVLHCGRNDDLSSTSDGPDACRNMYSQPTKIITAYFAFPSVESCTQLHTELRRGGDDGAGATNCSTWAIKGGDKAVSSRLDLLATESLKLISHSLIMSSEDAPPSSVAE